VLFSTHHLLIITTALITDLGAVSCASCFLAARPHSTESRFLSVGTRRAAHRRRLPDADRATRSRAQVDDQKSELSKKISAKQEEIAARKANHLVSPYSKSLYQRVPIKALLGDDEGVATIGQKIVVGGWVKTGRTADKGAAPPRPPPPLPAAAAPCARRPRPCGTRAARAASGLTRRVRLVREGGTRRVQLVREGGVRDASGLTRRARRAFAFLELNDGSCPANLQVQRGARSAWLRGALPAGGRRGALLARCGAGGVSD